MSGCEVSAVCLDAGNTLIYADPKPSELYAREMGRLGRPVTASQVGPAFAAEWAAMQAESPPGIDRYGRRPGGEREWWGEFVRRVVRRLEHDAPPEALLEALWAAFADPKLWRTYPEVEATLSALVDRGLRLAVVSNWDSRLPEILSDLGLERYFAALTVSRIEGIEKPNPEIFLRTVARLGVAPEAALHVGDSPLEDYRGAAGAGLTPVLIDRPGMFRDDGFRRIDRLDGLLGLLGP